MVAPRRQPMNPPQTAQLLGGSPPGMPPANAFDLDPAELDRMLAEGWTMYDDGAMAPPPTAGQLPMPGNMGGADPYGPGGYANAGPASGIGPAVGGNSPPAPPVQPPLGGPGPLPQMGGGPPAVLPPDPNLLGGPIAVPDPLAPPMADGASPLPGPGLLGGPPPGMVVPAPEIIPPIAGGGPSGGADVQPVGPPPLDPFAYTQEQNRVSSTPGGGVDPGGYVGGDVAARDPTKLLPARRRTDRNGSPARLNVPDPGMQRSFQPRPRRRP